MWVIPNDELLLGEDETNAGCSCLLTQEMSGSIEEQRVGKSSAVRDKQNFRSLNFNNMLRFSQYVWHKSISEETT